MPAVKTSAESARPLRVVIPKKGRLSLAFAAVMAADGLRVDKDNARQDFGVLRDDNGTAMGVEALQMRSNDALRTMAAGAADMAIVGLDMLREFNARNDALADAAVTKLGMAPCALYIATPAAMAADNARDLAGLRVATSFPGVLAAWLAENAVADVTIVECEGGVEDMVRLGLADAVCDLVETGNTLAANGLEKRMKVMDSEAVLVIRAAAPAGAEDVARRLCAAARQQAPVCA